jgi:hypothetical protein
MDNKNLIYALGGVALGYFLYKFINKKEETTEIVPSTQTPSQSLIDMCNKQLVEKTMTMRFGSEEAGKKFKEEFMAQCLGGAILH